MKNRQYGNAWKTVAFFMQMFSLMIVVVTYSLLASLFGRSMLSFEDVGNDSFFDSIYYAEKFEEETNELQIYLQMRAMPTRSELNRTKMKQYKLKFDGENTNLYYWYLNGEITYTNMQEGLTSQEALQEGKRLGSYLYYDDSTIHFEGNIKGSENYFSQNILRMFRHTDSKGMLVIAVDTSLAKEDVFTEADKIYSQFFPWIELALFFSIMAAMVFMLFIIYITLATGRNEDDEDIHLSWVDKIPTEVLFIISCLYMVGLLAFCLKMGKTDLGISGALVLSGTLAFVSDLLLVSVYLSFVRRLKADTFYSSSLIAWGARAVCQSFLHRSILTRMAAGFVFNIIAVLFLSWLAFAKKEWWGMFALSVLLFIDTVLVLRQANQHRIMMEGIEKIRDGDLDYKLNVQEYTGDNRDLVTKINTIGGGLLKAVEENVKSERTKSELITNLSHDIKTPLTSIINYVNLIKLENVQNENVRNYVDILDKKSLRLKQLMEDLVEISKITSGNVVLDMQPINMVELICQTGGEFNELFETKGLTVITRLPKDAVMIMADGNRIWRIVQNLYNNVAKYALKDTRVYVELKVTEEEACFSIKDISAQELTNTPIDLSERFVRGDESRATEGSGLGLSIAKNLTKLMGGDFIIELDGDLFTTIITFPVIYP